MPTQKSESPSSGIFSEDVKRHFRKRVRHTLEKRGIFPLPPRRIVAVEQVAESRSDTLVSGKLVDDYGAYMLERCNLTIRVTVRCLELLFFTHDNSFLSWVWSPVRDSGRGSPNLDRGTPTAEHSSVWW